MFIGITLFSITFANYTQSNDYIYTLDSYMNKQDQAKLFGKKIGIIKKLDITKYNTSKTYGIGDVATSKEALTMLNKFAKAINKPNSPITIFSGPKGKSESTDYITNGEFIAGLIKIIEGRNLDETRDHDGNYISHWTYNYFTAAYRNELLRHTVFMNDKNLLSHPAYKGDIAIAIANYIERFETTKCLDSRCFDVAFYDFYNAPQTYKYWIEMNDSKRTESTGIDIKVILPITLQKRNNNELIAEFTVTNQGSKNFEWNGIWYSFYLKTNNNSTLKNIDNLMDGGSITSNDTCYAMSIIKPGDSCVFSMSMPMSSTLLNIIKKSNNSIINWSYYIATPDGVSDVNPLNNQGSIILKL